MFSTDKLKKNPVSKSAQNIGRTMFTQRFFNIFFNILYWL